MPLTPLIRTTYPFPTTYSNGGRSREQSKQSKIGAEADNEVAGVGVIVKRKFIYFLTIGTKPTIA